MNETAENDWCPSCQTIVLIDWHTDERTGWDVHDACGTALVWHGKYDAEAASATPG